MGPGCAAGLCQPVALSPWCRRPHNPAGGTIQLKRALDFDSDRGSPHDGNDFMKKMHVCHWIRNGLQIGMIMGSMTWSGIGQQDPFSMHETPVIAGSWDLVVTGADGQTYPSWLEFEKSGYRTLVGRYVGQFGSVRPISQVHFDPADQSFQFVIPPQWERRTSDVIFEGRLDGEELTGLTTSDDGNPIAWKATRAPKLDSNKKVKISAVRELFNGADLKRWTARHSQIPNGWEVQNGILTNVRPGNDILTAEKFRDFKLHVEFRYPPGSNSGVYLRGRYEVQIEDNFGMEESSHRIGGVCGFLTPRLNGSKPAGEWQSMDITLIGRLVSVTLNGQPIIENQIIPGITGGALDSHEGDPGPILIQGDHGPVEYRRITLSTLSE